MNISSLFELLGQNIESDKVTSLLESNPSFEVGRPDSGSQYVISKELGVDLLFEPNEGFLAGKTKHLRNCQALFFYSEGRDGHSEFSGQLPFGFTFSSQRSELISKKKPLRTWKVGKGEVPVDFPNPSHDKWTFESDYISAHYNESGEIMYFIVSRQ